MWMQIVVGAAWLIWLSSGTAGLEKGLTVGALLVLGLGMKNILDTFWKRKAAERARAVAHEEDDLSGSSSRGRGFPGSRWTSSRTDDAFTSPALRGFARRAADQKY